MYPFNFISVGIDVGADFSWVSILTPDHKPVGKPFKILHEDTDSLHKAVITIKKAEELYSLKAHTFLESTGIYHLPLFYYLKELGFEVFILNPLVTHCNINSGIRKVKNDKFDSIRIAKSAYTHNLKVSLVPSDLVVNLRSLVREYYYIVDSKSSYINKIHKELRIVFPNYCKVFSDVTGKTSLAILKKYLTPNNILNAPKIEIVSLIANISRHGLDYANEKYQKLINAAKSAAIFGKQLDFSFDIIKMYLDFIDFFDQNIESILCKINKFILDHENNIFVKQIYLLDSIKGIGLISAVTLMCEIGDFSAFKKPKQLFAFFGIDPSVKESGNFKGTRVSMSKRGSKLARRVLFTVALVSISGSNNPVLKEYYQNKKESRPKMVAVGAIMHKISNIIFAVLRNNKPFVLITPKQHCKNHEDQLLLVA